MTPNKTNQNQPNGVVIQDGRPGFRIGGVFYRLTPCRYCGRNIAFVPTAAGKLQPTNADGVSHFATCEALRERREAKRGHKPMVQPPLFEEN